MNITHTQLNQVLTRAWETKKPIDIKGTIGIGKSQHVKDFAIQKAKELNLTFFDWNEESNKDRIYPERAFYFVDIRLSMLEPFDLRGLPDINGEVVMWKPNLIWAILSNPDAQGIVFFDEANTTNTAVLKACYQIIHDRQVGELPISSGILFVSAGNLLTDQCDVVEEPMALNNRRLNYILNPPTIDEWVDWATNNNIDDRIIAYLMWRRDYLWTEKPTTASFCSPRAWAMLSELILGVEDPEELTLYACGAVGEVGNEFVAFTFERNKVDVRALIKNPSNIQLFQKDIQRLCMAISLLASAYKEDPKTLNTMFAIAAYLSAEHAVLFMRLLARNTTNWIDKATACPNFTFILEKFGQVL